MTAPSLGLKLAHMRLVAAISDRGQLQQAAEEMGLTQPAASRMLGASPWTTFRTVELPLARGGLVVGLFFAAIFLFGDYATSRLIGGGTNPMLSDAISQYAGSGQWPVAAVLAVVLFVFATLVLGLLMRVYDLRQEL